ncbi:MAG: DUF308 domain-containing protein [Sphaerochaetaceae bacterium]
MKRKRVWIVQFLVALGLLIFGIFILAKPKLFEQLFIITLALVAIITGISSLVTLSNYSFNRFNKNSTLIKGVASIIIGVLAVVLPIAIGGAVWRIILYILAVQLFLSALVVLIDAFAVRSIGISPAPLVTEGIISLALAVTLVVAPRKIADLLVTILGVALIVIAVALGVIAFFTRKKNRAIMAEIEGEADVLTE